MIALASLNRDHAAPGTELQMEVTVEGARHKARAVVKPLPFFNPPRKTATPPF
jgi:glycine cleavage system aminomethyltransferase T